jgi:hypothetical protein
MTATSKTGAASFAGALAYTNYLTTQTLNAGQSRAAEYYYGTDTLRIRVNLSPEFAAALGIKAEQFLTKAEIGNLLNIRRADGSEIEGRKQHSAHQSVAEVFGLVDVRCRLRPRSRTSCPSDGPMGPRHAGRPRRRSPATGSRNSGGQSTVASCCSARGSTSWSGMRSADYRQRQTFDIEAIEARLGDALVKGRPHRSSPGLPMSPLLIARCFVCSHATTVAK